MDAFSPTNLVIHDISVSNLLLGEARLMRLLLPETWDIDRGLAPPDMSARHVRGGAPWMAAGQAWYVLYHKTHGWALELHVRISPKGKTPPSDPAETLTIAGHTAYLTWHTRRRGLPWKRHDVTFMTVTWYCPQTERHLSLEFSGWCPRQGFEQIRASLEHLRCH